MLLDRVNITSSQILNNDEDMPEPVSADCYDSLLRDAGGFGKYQAIVSMILVLGYTMMGKVIYGLVFLLLLP